VLRMTEMTDFASVLQRFRKLPTKVMPVPSSISGSCTIKAKACRRTISARPLPTRLVDQTVSN
jgi:hypothetical protein